MEQYRDLLDSLAVGIVAVDAAGQIVLANSQAEHMFGYERGTLEGNPALMLVPERHRASYEARLAMVGAQRQARPGHAELGAHGLHRDGREFPAAFSLSPLETASGRLVCCTVRDAGESVRLEEALQDAEHRKGEFLASVAHELRTPLNGVLGFAEFLLEGNAGPLGEEQKEYVADIMSCGRQLLQLVDEAFDLSMAARGGMTLHNAPFSLPEAMAEVCALMAGKSQDKGIDIRHSVARTLRQVRLDRRRLLQVLSNLLTSAIKFTAPGGEIRIDASPQGSSGLCLKITASGIGRRTEDSLGLELTRKIVEAQSGIITADSAPGRGSTFTIILPGAIAAAPQSPVDSTP
ncbi:MAG TPA: PAS domain-containing sensor histidine kinase [Steroidobacteraceae bacterium]